MNLVFKGKKLKTRRANLPIAKKRREIYVEGAKKLFVGALPSKLTFKEFRDYFCKFGPITDIFLPMKDKLNKVNRGHGFVTFDDTESVRLVLESAEEHCIRDKLVSLIDRYKDSQAT